jgi:hypothetical protein
VKMLFALALALGLVVAAPVAQAGSGSSHGTTPYTSSSSHASRGSVTHGHPSSHASESGHGTQHGKAVPGVTRDKYGNIERSAKARDDFKRAHPCPATGKTWGACHGWVVDHVTPLKRGGADAPSNMQWQTRSEAKAKDKWE